MPVAVMGLALLLSSGVATAAAQHRQFGGKIGPTIATVVSDSADQEGVYRRKTALGGGGFVVLPLNGRLALQIEALFTPKGGKLPSDQTPRDLCCSTMSRCRCSGGSRLSGPPQDPSTSSAARRRALESTRSTGSRAPEQLAQAALPTTSALMSSASSWGWSAEADWMPAAIWSSMRGISGA